MGVPPYGVPVPGPMNQSLGVPGPKGAEGAAAAASMPLPPEQGRRFSTRPVNYSRAAFESPNGIQDETSLR